MATTTSKALSGVLAGGNWIIDQVKMVDVYPQPESLGNILSQSQGTGGAPYNVLIDLAKAGAPFPLFGLSHSSDRTRWVVKFWKIAAVTKSDGRP